MEVTAKKRNGAGGERGWVVVGFGGALILFLSPNPVFFCGNRGRVR
jgi:hypothetical protein